MQNTGQPSSVFSYEKSDHVFSAQSLVYAKSVPLLVEERLVKQLYKKLREKYYTLYTETA